jgi:hypothetical protein
MKTCVHFCAQLVKYLLDCANKHRGSHRSGYEESYLLGYNAV